MKKIIVAIISLSMLIMLTGCGMDKSEINIATLNGPTGIGMVKLMDEYNVQVYQSPTDVAAKVINGDCDIAALPSNMAAVLYNKTKGKIKCLATIALGNLYLVQNGSDANGTILASGEGGTPEYVLKTIMPNSKVKWLASHSDVVQALLKTDGAVAMIPEPFVTMALSKSDKLEIIADLNDEWEKQVGSDLPMGVIIVTKSFAEEHPKEVDSFINAYQKSVEFVNDHSNSAELVVEKGFFANETLAQKAIPGCKICYDDNHEMIEKFYQKLFKLNPQSIGGKLPDEEFYY